MTNESSDKDPRKTWDTIGEEDPYCGTGGPTRVLLGSDGNRLGRQITSHFEVQLVVSYLLVVLYPELF